MPLALDLLLIHGHTVVPTGGCFDLLLFDGHMVVPTGELMVNQWLWISRVHPVEWLFNGDGMVLEMMDLPSCLLVDGQWKLVKLELSPLIRWIF